MSLTGFLKFGETFLPITRGELVKDSNGDIAFHSPLFEAKATDDPTCPGGRYGLITGAEKKILQALLKEDSTILNQAPLSIQFGEKEAYIYNGKEDLEIQLVAGDNITIEDDESGGITIAANDPTVKIETITTATDQDYPIILTAYSGNSESRITTYKHANINYNPYTQTLIVPYIKGSSEFAKYIDTDAAIGTSTNPIYVTKEGKVVASNGSVGSSSENSAQPIYLQAGELTTIDATIGGPVEGTDGFQLSYMASGLMQSYQGDLGNNGQYPLCVEKGILQHASAQIGDKHRGIYMAAGALTQMDYYLKANIHPGTDSAQASYPLAVYSSSSDIKKLAVNVGEANQPLRVLNGVLSPITIPANTGTLYIVGTFSGTLTNGKLCTGTQSTSGVRMIGGNTIYAAGGFYESSDETLKDFTEDVEVNLDALSNLPKKHFTWKNDKSKSNNIGTSAQELQKLYPELVSKDEIGLLNVAYDKLSIIALAAIDKLYKEISELKQVNNDLLVRIQQLENIKYNGKRD